MITDFRDATPCNLVESYEHFGRTCRLLRQGRGWRQHVTTRCHIPKTKFLPLQPGQSASSVPPGEGCLTTPSVCGLRLHGSIPPYAASYFSSFTAGATCYREKVVTTATLSRFPCRYIQPLRCSREVSYPTSLPSDNTPGRSGLKSRPQTRYPD
jgi:hypothetical protein